MTKPRDDGLSRDVEIAFAAWVEGVVQIHAAVDRGDEKGFDAAVAFTKDLRAVLFARVEQFAKNAAHARTER